MPVYVYRCEKHGRKEIFSRTPDMELCPRCGVAMDRDYSAERAGLPPFKGYYTEALDAKVVRIDSREQERHWEKKTGLTRIK